MGVILASRPTLGGHRPLGRHEVEETIQFQFVRPEEDMRDGERFAIDGDPEMEGEKLAVREFLTLLPTTLPFTRAVSPNILHAFLLCYPTKTNTLSRGGYQRALLEDKPYGRHQCQREEKEESEIYALSRGKQ